MPRYSISTTETIRRIYEVTAPTKEDAVEILEEFWDECLEDSAFVRQVQTSGDGDEKITGSPVVIVTSRDG